MVDRVFADPSRIRGVLLNLYVNALDAQPDGGALRMSSDLVLGSDGPTIRLLIEDAGPGIPPANRDRVFQPFFTTKSGGSGIGLAISRETLRIHGGDLTLVPGSSPATGAAFSLTLPVAESALEGFDRAWLTEGMSQERPDQVRPTLSIAKG